MNLIPEELIKALGLTILDSLWQGAALLLVCTVLLLLLRSRSAQVRYRVVLISLLALPVASVFTFSGHYEPLTVMATEFTAFSSVEQLIPASISAFTVTEDLSLIEHWQAWAFNNASWVALIWGFGLLLFTTRLLGGFYIVRSLKSSATYPQDGVWAQRLAELTQSLNLKVPVAIKESVKVSSPIVLGYLKPLIIFPIGLLQGIPTDQVEAILLHELAHIKRHDYLVNLLVSLLQVVYFYHPAYWWLQQQLDVEREYSCDDLVLENTSSMSLVKALAAVKEYQVSGYTPSLGFAGQKNQLLKRVERIMKKKTRTNWLGGLISMSALLLSFFLMSYRSVSSEEMPVSADAVTIEAIAEEGTPKAIEQIDSLSIDEAILQLLNQKDNNLELEMDGKGRLIDLKRNGEPIGQIELKIFRQAHAKLRNYGYSEREAEKERMKEVEARHASTVKQYKEELNMLAQRLEKEVVGMSRAEREETKRTLELMRKEFDLLIKQDLNPSIKLREIELMELLRDFELTTVDIRGRIDTDRGVAVSRELNELLKYYPEMLRHFKEGKWGEMSEMDSIQISIQNGVGADKLKLFEIKVRELLERTESISLEDLKRTEERLIDVRENRRLVNEYMAVMDKLKSRGALGSGKYEFTENEWAQKQAVIRLAKQDRSTDRALVVLNGEVKEGWTVADLNKLERNQMIKSVYVTRARQVEQARFKAFMKDRDVLIEIVTIEGAKGYVRPKIKLLQNRLNELSETEMKEHFSKVLLEQMMADGIIPKGWSTLSLSTQAFIINGKKQPKKVLKRYLKLYKSTTGNPLAKGKTIELRE